MMKKWILLIAIFIGIIFLNIFPPILQYILGAPTYADILTALFGDQIMMGSLFSLVLIALIIWTMATLISKYSLKQ